MTRLALQRRLRASAFIVTAVLIAACKDSTAPQPSPHGNWSGTTDGMTLNLNLTVNGGTVTGTGSFVGGGETFPLSVTGDFSHPIVALTLSSTQFAPVAFTSVSVTATTMTARLNGSGFENDAIILNRK